MNTPPSTSNGMAIAALVLGLSGLVLFFTCGFGILLCVLGIVFGFIGLSKAKQIGKGKGMSLAGIILGAVGIIGGILFIVLIAITADDANDDRTGAADTSDYDITTNTCEIDDLGTITFAGTIDNTAGRNMDFTVNVQFRDRDDGSLIDTDYTTVTVPEGDTVRWTTTGFGQDGDSVRCEVDSVDNYYN